MWPNKDIWFCIKPTSLLEVLSFSDIMVGGDEVQVQEVQEGNAREETQMLTNEEIKEIKEEVDEKEETDILAALLKKTIDTILVEEFFEANTKMNEFRRVLAQGVLLFPEKHTEDKAKVDRLVDSFRAAWKVYKGNGDEKDTLDVFMKEMDDELWLPLCSEDTKAWLYTWYSSFTFH